MIHAQQPPSSPIIIQENKVTVDELAGMVARGFKESERNMKEFIREFVHEEISQVNVRIDKLENKVDNLETKMDTGFASLHKRFDSVIVRHA